VSRRAHKEENPGWNGRWEEMRIQNAGGRAWDVKAVPGLNEGISMDG